MSDRSLFTTLISLGAEGKRDEDDGGKKKTKSWLNVAYDVAGRNDRSQPSQNIANEKLSQEFDGPFNSKGWLHQRIFFLPPVRGKQETEKTRRKEQQKPVVEKNMDREEKTRECVGPICTPQGLSWQATITSTYHVGIGYQ